MFYKLDIKTRFKIFICIFVLAVGFILIFHNINHKKRGELVASYTSTFHHVDIYRTKKDIVIYAYSQGDIDEANTINVPVKGEISENNIEVRWTTIVGKEVEKDSDNVISAKIKIKQDGNVIFDQSISLFEKGWDAIGEAMDN